MANCVVIGVDIGSIATGGQMIQFLAMWLLPLSLRWRNGSQLLSLLLMSVPISALYWGNV